MCKCIEDCLASKAGFRLFLTVVVVIVTVAVGVNVAFLLKSMEINNEGAEEPKTPVIERLKELHSVLVLTEDPGYPQELLSRINYLRHNQCPDIKDCTFTSATSPGENQITQLAADAVVVVGGAGTFQNYTLEGLKTRHGDRIASSKSRPITAQLMSSPKDFRDSQALGRRHIRSGH